MNALPVEFVFAVAGVTELLKRLYAKDWLPAVTIVVAGVVGALVAPQVSLTWFQGLLGGLSASGFITSVSYFGTK